VEPLTLAGPVRVPGQPGRRPAAVLPAATFGAGSMALPQPLDVEVARPELVDRLAGRWDRPITLVVAGAGFGKTTVLAQAVRAHLLAPRGIDAWVCCEPAHEDPARLVQALLAALADVGEPGGLRPGGGVRAVVDALVRRAPLEVCLLLDDVHEIPAGSPGAALLAGIAAALPATAHLVLSGREAPDLPLARREAAGQLIRIDAADLAFTEAEVATLARRLGREPAVAGALHGWPALVRLAFAAGPAAPWQYAREEILGRLPAPQRRALAALAALGSATAGEVAEVTGGPVALDDLARRIPLVAVLDDGRFRAHDLWTDAVCRSMTAAQAQVLRRRAVGILRGRGDLTRAGRLAQQAQDWPLLAGLAVELVRTTLSALPRATAQRWLGAVPPSMADEPAFVLLRAAVLHAGDFTDPGIDQLLDRAWQGMLDRGDDDGAAATLGQASVAAHSRADGARLAAVLGWADRLDAPSSPVLRLLRHTAAAMLAEVGGDPEAALAHLAPAPVGEVPQPLALNTWRFRYHCLNMSGRCGEAAELADRTLADADDELVRLSAAVARWFDGDPSDLCLLRGAGRAALGAGAPAGLDRPPAATAREAFVAGALAAVMAASCGDGPSLPPLAGDDPDGHDNPRDAALACAARAAAAVARDDEPAARQVYASYLARWPVRNRLAERHLRRFLALGYVLSDRLRAHWDRADLGPSHRAARAAARALLAARAGQPGAGGELAPAHALCFLPLPWSVEVAARLAAAERPAGYALGGWLADTLGPAVHRQFRAAAQAGDGAVAAGSARLLAVLPAPPRHRTGIEVLGTVRLTRDGVLVDPPELRRARVRQLLSLLVLHPVLRREQAVDLLWPGLGPVEAARNMRVTLTHLRRLLEPDRSGGDASYHLRTDAEAIRLVRSESLTADLWTVELLAAAADRARADGDSDRAADLLGQAVARWSGDPVPDLHTVQDPATAAEVDRLRDRHVRDLLTLGELRLVAGDPAEAGTLADRALALEPFDARGHRLTLAAALHSRSPGRTAAARRRVLAALRQLGAPPDPATALLLRQAAP
jgi:DNA-binding SARP family transcriptional activator